MNHHQKSTKNIVFMGSNPIILPLLDYLNKHQGATFKLHSIFTQPDRPQGRGKQLTPNPIKQWAQSHKVSCLQPEKLSPQDIRWLQNEHIDLVLVMAYGHILKKDFLSTPPLGVYNFHGSILPAYRGASPVEAAIAQGDEETGVCLMKIVPQMDAGPVVDIEYISIDDCEKPISLRKKLAQACIPLLERNLEKLLNNKAVCYEQDPKHASYVRKITKDDGWIDFSLSSKSIEQRIRAFDPWPGSFFKYQEIIIKVGQARVLQEATKATPGTVIAITHEGLLVATSDGCILFEVLQRPSGKMLPAEAFLRGFHIPRGALLQGKASEPLCYKK